MWTSTSLKEKREHPRYLARLPLDYWETSDVLLGGLVANISERGLLFHSVHEMQIGTNLGIRVYLSKDYSLDQVEGAGKIAWRNLHQEQDWKGYKYGFHILQMVPEDRERLIKYFLNLQEEMSSPNGEQPLNSYEKYILALSNKKRETSVTQRGLRKVNEIFHRSKL